MTEPTTGLRPLSDVAAALGLPSGSVQPWGRDRAKIDLSAARSARPGSKLILVSAINPTPAGEGKTTMSIALAQGLQRLGKNAVAVLREPSLGPVFGVKGGGTGGGKCTLEPADAINLHFTGDLHAITAAHNLLAALLDNAIVYRDPVEIEPRTVTWPRALDMNDRSLRQIIVGLGGKGNGVARETRFDITAASEVMAVLCLSENLADLQERCARIVVGYRRDGAVVRAGDLFAAASMTALLKDALMPNLVQTQEGGPAIVHGGPFANIAHGCNSIIATRMGLAYADYVVTEAGFGFDLGGEKFLDIKCRLSAQQGEGFAPAVVVLVTTLRALRYHSGEDATGNWQRGLRVLDQHVRSVRDFGAQPLVLVNAFPDDTPAELELLRAHLRTSGTQMAVCGGYAHGGAGAEDAAEQVVSLASSPQSVLRYSYDLSDSIEEKIRRVAKRIYGARDVVLSPDAAADAARITAEGGGQLPVCVAKTHLSLSDDPKKRGQPEDFVITVRELRHSAGAGFVVALCGELLTMPGLPKIPSARRVHLHADGRISGLMQNS